MKRDETTLGSERLIDGFSRSYDAEKFQVVSENKINTFGVKMDFKNVNVKRTLMRGC